MTINRNVQWARDAIDRGAGRHLKRQIENRQVYEKHLMDVINSQFRVIEDLQDKIHRLQDCLDAVMVKDGR